MIQLRVISGPHSGLKLDLSKSSVLLGRSKNCDLVLKLDSHVSRFHGEIFRTGSTLSYQDLGSKTGSVIESAGSSTKLGLFLPKCPLRNRDRIRIGDSTIEVQCSKLRSQLDEEENDSSLSVTLFETTLKESDVYPINTSVVEQFLHLPESDLTDLRQATEALCAGFLDVFRQLDQAAIISLNAPLGTRALTRDDIDYENTAFAQKDQEGDDSGFSFSILERTAKSRTVVMIKSQDSFPNTESVASLAMKTCICAPMFDENDIIGFVQLHGSKPGSGPGNSEIELFRLLVAISALIFRQVKSSHAIAKARQMASVGQVVAALSHDARSILESLGSFSGSLEREIPELVTNKKWAFIREDLRFMRFLIRHTRTRMVGRQQIQNSNIELDTWARGILDACQRYFINEVDQDRIRLKNLCAPGSKIYSDPDLLTVAFLNCVKNAIDAYLSIDRDASSTTSFSVVVSCYDARESPDDYFLLNIADTAGGIPEHVLNRMGRELVTTKGDKGTGLGFQIVVDTVNALGGVVQIASCNRSSNDLPAGTIVSFRLPKHANAAALGDPESPIVEFEDYEEHFNYIYS